MIPFEARPILLSIFPAWAEAILVGKKRWEYRRVVPRTPLGTRVILLATGPKGALVGEFRLGGVVRCAVSELVERTCSDTPHSRQDIFDYFRGLAVGNAMRVEQPVRYQKPVTLGELKSIVPRFVVPQSFRYLDSKLEGSDRLMRLLPVPESSPAEAGLFGQDRKSVV